ncbi:MarR family winged helix-turn-helix transcriptional regulator [Marinomonas epiphytica]
MKDHVDKILTQWKKHKPELNCSPMGVMGRVERMGKFIAPNIDNTINQFGLTRIEFDILATLRRSDSSLTPTQLYQDTMLSSGTMSTRLEHIVKKGWIERSASTHDRRSCTITLTTTGLELIDKVLAEHVENEARLLACLSQAEQEQLAHLLGKWLAHYESQDHIN